MKKKKTDTGPLPVAWPNCIRPQTGPSARAFFVFLSLGTSVWALAGRLLPDAAGWQQIPFLAAGWARATPPVLRD
jgi:hypothetical protein